MAEKVVLILVDGMRPDGMMQCGNDYAKEILRKSTYSLKTQTVMPSVTLPCHMSLFHSVGPERHGILTNTYTPQVRPIDGLFDQLHKYDKKNGFFYTWEELRDLGRPGSIDTAVFHNLHTRSGVDKSITKEAIDYIQTQNPDFVFLYLGETDEVGHVHGWMGPEYLNCVSGALDCVKTLEENIPSDYTIILTADHGGHGRCHGTDLPEDMTTPLCIWGPKFEADKEVEGLSIKDIAPTVAALLEVPSAKEWEGRVL
ncbi:MAG: alkaline phosphatase family protein [Clostridia bacterium]|nr:alkaline phosphatase family protein [Clostridia bacterium]